MDHRRRPLAAAAPAAGRPDRALPGDGRGHRQGAVRAQAGHLPYPSKAAGGFRQHPLEDLADKAELRLGGPAEWPRQHRTSGYTVQDWQQLLAENASIHQRLLDAMNSGAPAGDPAVMDLAEEHRQHTDRWYQDCGHEIHRQYAQA